MGKLLRVLGLSLSFGLLPGYASQISGASDFIGTTFEVVGTSGATGVDDVQKGSQLTGMIATAVFDSPGGNVIQTCTFSLGTCVLGSQFSVVVTPDTSQTSAANWVISNLSTLNMLSLTMNGIYTTGTPPTARN